MDRWYSRLKNNFGTEPKPTSQALSKTIRPKNPFSVTVSDQILQAYPTLTGRGTPFSYHILAPKSSNNQINGGETTIRYEYEYQNSKDSLDQVEKTLKAKWTPDFSRNIHIANASTLSQASVSIHLRELQRRGKAIKVGKEWIHRENISELEVWQLKRVIDRLDQKHDLAAKLEQRYEDKLQIRKEYLREMGDEMSAWKFDQEQQEVIELEDKVNHYREKQKWLRESKRRVFGMIKEVQESNSKESGNCQPLLKSKPNKVVA